MRVTRRVVLMSYGMDVPCCATVLPVMVVTQDAGGVLGVASGDGRTRRRLPAYRGESLDVNHEVLD